MGFYLCKELAKKDESHGIQITGDPTKEAKEIPRIMLKETPEWRLWSDVERTLESQWATFLEGKKEDW